jgi:hypothetical protein
VYESQFITAQHTSGHFNVSTVYDHHARPTLLYTSILVHLTVVRYRDEILQPHLMHVIDQQRELFQQENARPHTARLTMDYLA